MIAADCSTFFTCPVSEEDVHWMAKDVFNRGGGVLGGRFHLLVRRPARTSCGCR